MATHYNTRIVTDNLVLNLDAGNTKSYAGDITYGTDYGYFGGGSTGGGSSDIISTMDRVDYSNDTATALARGSLNTARTDATALSNQSFGYWAGGVDPSPANNSTVNRLDFANDL